MKLMKHFSIGGRILATLFFLSFVFFIPAAYAQGTLSDYQRAQALREKLQGLAVNVPGQTNWITGTNHFWYRKSVAGGYEFILVDADALTKQPAFDHEKLAAALSTASGKKYTAITLPFAEAPAGRGGGRGGPGGAGAGAFTFTDQEHAIDFVMAGFNWKCNLTSYECRTISAVPPPTFGGRGGRGPVDDSFESSPAPEDDLLVSPAMVDADPIDGIENLAPQFSPQQGQGGRGGFGANGQPLELTRTSPDGNWEALIENYNVFLRRKGETETAPLSLDGSEGNYYTLRSIVWSWDSKHLVAYRTRPGYQREVHYVESSPADQVQPKHFTLVYAKPGDTLDVAQPTLFEVATKKEIQIDGALFPNAFDITLPVWWKDSRAFTFEYNQRGHQLYRVIEVDAQTGKARAVITEESKTFVDYRPLAELRSDTGKKFRHDLADGKEIIWGSERDGWEHLYLYDGATVKVKNQITKGNWIVRYVDFVDEEKRQVWFRASGMVPGQDPYFTHYYRINFDGTGLVRLTDADGDHTVRFSDPRNVSDSKYYVDTWSRVDLAPVSQLRRTEDRKVLMELERGDISALLAAGWKPPEVFVSKGRDGATDIWGVIFRPTNFDESKKYPVIENIYAGPQGSFVPKTFSGAPQPLAELGFIVVQMDGMGTNNRSRAFHDVAFQNLADAGFPDRILWHKAAAAKYPWYDITRVGIYGTSAGGQNSLGGMLFHPEFYKVAVSNSGCHDNRMDKIWWNEQWMGWPIGPQYSASSNVDNAYRLQGKLMLVLGELDNNVDPSSTLQVVNQLIKHDKKFDLLFVPGGGHGAGGAYGQHLLQDFFVHNLMGVEPPDWKLLEQPAAATPSGN
ncbi:MAG: prolyl oligopeptidase family serine peptidase [Candidatus Acidiferrales bacterium]